MFRIEPANNEGSCEYDYLEIRDGDQGYAPLIGKSNLHWSLTITVNDYRAILGRFIRKSYVIFVYRKFW